METDDLRRSSRRAENLIRESSYLGVLESSAPRLEDIPELRTASGRTLSPPTAGNLEIVIELLGGRVQNHLHELDMHLGVTPFPQANVTILPAESNPLPDNVQLEE